MVFSPSVKLRQLPFQFEDPLDPAKAVLLIFVERATGSGLRAGYGCNRCWITSVMARAGTDT
jgi:hypothetical protein